jgi:methylene-tetrahydrofolate reductase-like protein
MIRTPSAFEPSAKPPRDGSRFALRFWSIRHARGLETLYRGFERMLVAAAPALAWLGLERLERPVARVEKFVKGALFDCRMCGQCALSSTGMSCPMNCPKGLRNGPCGGVRANGNCEVYAEMPCVWVKAYEGSLAMREGARISVPQPAIDHRLKGRSAWLAVARQELAAGQAASKQAGRVAA